MLNEISLSKPQQLFYFDTDPIFVGFFNRDGPRNPDGAFNFDLDSDSDFDSEFNVDSDLNFDSSFCLALGALLTPLTPTQL